MSQWKSDCFSAACPLWLFQVSSRQPKLNLLQSLAKPSKAWTGCYELICCKAPWRSVLEETNCLTMPCKAWTGCCLFIKESCHTVASFFDSRGCFLAQNACTEATNSSAARRPCEAFLKKRTVWQSLAEPELGMFFHQRIMCHCCHVCCCLASVFLRKMPVRKLLCLWFLLSFFAVWWHLFLLYSDDIQAQIQVVDLATCESLAQMRKQFA